MPDIQDYSTHKRNQKSNLDNFKSSLVSLPHYSTISIKPYNDNYDNYEFKEALRSVSHMHPSQPKNPKREAYVKSNLDIHKVNEIDPEYTKMIREQNKLAFGHQPVKILHDKPHNDAIKYMAGKRKKFCLYDDVVDFDKKFYRQPPNQYFKTEKGQFLTLKKLDSEKMFSTKKHEFSKLPMTTFIDEVTKTEKKKIGPNHYKDMFSDHRCTTQEDRTGQYKDGMGPLKMTSPHMQMFDHF